MPSRIWGFSTFRETYLAGLISLASKVIASLEIITQAKLPEG
jgi:hypothetical protein